MKYTPPPGMKRIRDWYGRRIKLNRMLVNGCHRAPAGAFARVRNWSTVGFSIESDPCKCCGVSLFFSRVDNSAFQDAPDVTPEGHRP